MPTQQHADGDQVKAPKRHSRPVRTQLELEALPDSALINEAENCLILNVCRTSNWRGVKDGSLPPPIKVGKRMNRYIIGRARKVARGEAWA